MSWRFPLGAVVVAFVAAAFLAPALGINRGSPEYGTSNQDQDRRDKHPPSQAKHEQKKPNPDRSNGPKDLTASTTSTMPSTTTTPTTSTATTTTTTTTVPSSGSACPSDGPQITLSGPQSDQYKNREVVTNTSFDARTASWVGADDYPVRVRGGSTICWQGGRLEGTYPDSDSWDRLHDTAGFSVESRNFTLLEIRVHNYGDAINLTDDARNFIIRGVHLTFIRDDCVENDKLYSGVLEDLAARRVLHGP